jgi:hypothetical protein
MLKHHPPAPSAATPGRRAAMLSTLAVVGAAAAAAAAAATPRRAEAAPAGATTPPEDVSGNELVQKLLAKSNAPGVRERRKKERLEAYNDKIYGEGYFDVEIGQGSARSRGISDGTAGAIEAWQRAREARLAAKRRGGPPPPS